MNTLQSQQTQQTTQAAAHLARVVDSSTGELHSGTALRSGSALLFGPQGPGLSYVPYLAVEGESLIAVRRYADALHFERIRTPEQEAAEQLEKEQRKEAAWRDRVHDPREALEADKEKTGKRGVVRGFSDDSRRRMARHCARMHNLATSSFGALTLSDEIVERHWNRWEARPDVELMSDYLRHNLEKLQKRGERFWSRTGHTFGITWRLENQRRKSGRFQGHLVPHIHVIATGLDDVAVTRQRRWLKAAWWHLCGKAADGHERAGVQLDKVRSRAGAGVYVSKYVTKRLEDAEDAQLEIGRRWGTMGKVDTSGEDVAVITLAQYIQIRRYVARWLLNRWKGGRRYARIIRRPREADHALFIFGAGFESATATGLSESLMRSIQELGP